MAASAVAKRGGLLRVGAASAALTGVVLLALASVNLVLAILSPLDTSDTDVRTAGGPERLEADMSVLRRSNPFSGAPEVRSAAPITEELPVTNLRLKLKGVYVSDAGDSTALIETPGGDQEVFREDEEVVRGVRLRRIDTYRVVIDRNGILESLLLENRPEPESGPAPSEADEPVPSRKPEADEPAAGERPERTLASIAGGLMPILEKQGLQASDVPVAIDGQPLPAGEADLRQLLPGLRSRESVTVTVRRSGELVDVELSASPGVNL